VLPLGGRDWLPARVAWLGSEHNDRNPVDAALWRLDAPETWEPPPGIVQWGRLPPAEPVSTAAIGFPWAQQRPDTSRGTDHVVGFVTPPPDLVSGLLAVHVVSSAPLARADRESPWAGMSGAALIAGPSLVGIVVVDPARY
jgi:hypothetical protein